MAEEKMIPDGELTEKDLKKACINDKLDQVTGGLGQDLFEEKSDKLFEGQENAMTLAEHTNLHILMPDR